MLHFVIFIIAFNNDYHYHYFQHFSSSTLPLLFAFLTGNAYEFERTKAAMV